MVRNMLSLNDLKKEIEHYEADYPHLKKDDLFILWFLRAYVTDDDKDAIAALTGESRDKNIDAILIDDRAKMVFIVQGKYRETLYKKTEKRNDVLEFTRIANDLWGDQHFYESLVQNIAVPITDRLKEARERLKRRSYTLKLYYITLGRCSEELRSDADRLTVKADGPTEMEILDGKRIMALLMDYIDGVAPPVPSLDLEITVSRGTQGSILRRYDEDSNIESWIFSMSGKAIADLYEKTGTRLFARNVRGYLGRTEINEGMENTLGKEPDKFWYYNNGLTILCDEARSIGSNGKDCLRVSNPQVINGQQTTRALHSKCKQASNAAVMVRVIRVPRDPSENQNLFENLLSRIVACTNWQNAIKASDLMSNDNRQIQIEKEFNKLGYHYLRKRMSKGEVRRLSGHKKPIIKKEHLAKALAACQYDPALVRKGVEKLFEERYYGELFRSEDPYYYLSRYHLMKEVEKQSKGYPERAYAKWVVMKFIWDSMAQCVRARHSASIFVKDSLGRKGAAVPLGKVINAAFKGCSAFYKQKRGRGEKALDPSVFFMRVRQDREFKKYWTRNGGKYKRSFKKYMKKFESEIRQAD